MSERSSGGGEGAAPMEVFVCERKECGQISHRDVGYLDGKPYHCWARCLASVERVEVVELSRCRELEAERDALGSALRRLKHDALMILEQRSVRNFDETLAEVDAALSSAGPGGPDESEGAVQ